MTRRSLLALFTRTAFGLALIACDLPSKPKGPVARAQFGIFFGGQVQEREQIPFELDRSQQIQGFRIEFREPVTEKLKITWEINRPDSVARGAPAPLDAARQRDSNRRGQGRRVELHEARARLGQTRYDELIAFKPGDPLGTWNIRVLVENELLIDRQFLVYDARERARAMRDDAGT